MKVKIKIAKRRKSLGILTTLRGFTREILVGVVIGVIVLGLTPLVNSLTTSANTRKKQYSDLSSVSIGMSRGYLDDLFGFPVIETVPSRYEEYETLELISTGYRLKNCVLLCMFEKNSLVAYVVAVNSKGLYPMPYMTQKKNQKLLEFSYTDILSNQELLGISGKGSMFWMKANVPASSSVYAYYYEVYYGAGPADYNYFLYGNYMDYMFNEGSSGLMSWGQCYCDGIDNTSDENLPKYLTLREQVCPNTFGVISGSYAKDFNFVFDIIQTRENGGLLFDDWFTE